MRRRVPTPSRRLRLRARFAALGLAGLVAVRGLGFFFLRDSSLVAITQVEVVGASGPDAPRIESALRASAQDMTTLAVDEGELRRAVDGFPIVGSLKVDRDFPHGVRITVLERRPVAVATIAGRRVPITADGRVLRGATAPSDLPSLQLEEAPTSRVEGAEARRLLAMVAAAPAELRRRADRATLTERGLTLSMSDGPELFFGTAEDLRAKWLAAARVLADPTTEGATYVDVRVPARAAVGGLEPLITPEQQAPPADPLAEPTTPVIPEQTDPTVPSPSTGA